MMAAMNIQDHGMSLKQLLADFVAINCVPDIAITGLNLDSRQIQPGNVFIALEGQNDHGLTFAEAAVNKGAVAVLCDRRFDEYCQQILSALMTRVICIPINNLKEHIGEIASRFYAEPSRNMFTVGITGTDGKTSVSHFIAQALDEENKRSAVIGTIGNGLINELETATHTTPDVVQMHRLLADLNAKGAEQVAMEVSSHGLHQGRANAVEFDVAVLTNLGRDHLDYHQDMESYRDAKKLLFKQKNLKAAVLNLDDEFGRQLATELNDQLNIWGYTTQDSDACGLKNVIRASGIHAGADGLSAQIKCPQGEADIQLNLLGDFNVSNALATLAVLLIKGDRFAHAMQRLQKLNTVSGRMETIRSEGKPLVVVDYAHTSQALSSVLKTLRQHCEQKLICVFGCGGDRDQGKRPLMAEAAESLADEVIVTDDNPRTENAEQIVKEIQSGFKNIAAVQVIHDREQAICTAIKNAKENDIVLIAGKGHEDYQIIGNEKRAFSDTEVIKKCMGVTK